MKIIRGDARRRRDPLRGAGPAAGLLAGLALLAGGLAHAEDPASFWSEPRRGTNFFNGTERAERFEAAAAAGIKFVRIAPNKWKATGRDFLLGDADHFVGIPAADLAQVRRALDEAQGAGLKVVLTTLSLPGARWRQQNGNQNDFRLYREPRFAAEAEAFWRELATALKGHPALVGYNLLNEPNPELASGPADYWSFDFAAHARRVAGSAADLNALYARLAGAVRGVDALTPIVLDSGLYATPWALPVLTLLKDPRILYSIHMYEPYTYTNHKQNQGRFVYPGAIPDDAEASASARPWDKEALRRFLAPVDAWQRKHHLAADRLLVGEFGVDRRARGADRYLADLIDLFEERRWHWAFYAFREDTWDAMDYEIGDRPLPAAYWKDVEAGGKPQPPRSDNHLWRVLQRGLAR